MHELTSQRLNVKYPRREDALNPQKTLQQREKANCVTPEKVRALVESRPLHKAVEWDPTLFITFHKHCALPPSIDPPALACNAIQILGLTCVLRLHKGSSGERGLFKARKC